MPTTIRVEVQGLDQMLGKLHGNTVYAGPMKMFFRAAARTVWTNVMQRTPRITGNLQQHLYARVDQSPFPKYAEVGFQPLKYAPLVEFGTGIYGPSGKPITPTVKQALAFQVGGKTIVRRSVRGMQPRRMLRDGWAASVTQIHQLLTRAAEQIGETWRGQR